MQTIVTMVSPSQINMGASGGGGSATLTSDSNYAAGSTTIKVTGSTPPAGTTAQLSQCDNVSSRPCGGTYTDNGGLFVCGDTLACAQQARGNTFEHQSQILYIQSVVNNGDGTFNVTISSPGIHSPNWAFSHSPKITWNDTQYNAVGVGLEDLTLVTPVGYAASHLIEMFQAYASWVKGVRFVGSGYSTGLIIGGSKNVLVTNNYFMPVPYIDTSYPPAIQQFAASDGLIINNIMHGSTTWEGNGGNSGNVFAYNYTRDTFTAYYENTPFDHAGWSDFALFEGNQTGGILDDNTWGAHGINTFFRNYLSCGDPPYETQFPRGLAIDAFHRFDNAIGNTIGSYCTVYQGTVDGSAFRLDTSDSLVTSTLMRWGNCDTVTGTCRFQSSEVPSSLAAPNVSFSNPVPSTSTLPSSSFLSTSSSGGTGLSWWKVCRTWTTFPTSCAAFQTQPFPTTGPDVSGGPYVNGHAYDVPAAVAWQNLPLDTTYQTSYTVTGSSWSGGIETLTITGLPDVTHLMGGFQLSGANAACLPASGVSYTGRTDNEILITDSSSTTVTYALPVNPGLSCTGTFKFPNVRQFDQRVYALDASATGPAIKGKIKGRKP